MNPFERRSTPSVADQAELLSKQRAFEAERAEIIGPLLTEAAELEVEQELAAARLRSARARSERADELLGLETDGPATLRPIHSPSGALVTAEEHHKNVTAKVEHLRERIEASEQELRIKFNLESGP